MAFKTLSTANTPVTASKTLVIGIHGSGKTTQAKNYQSAFGKGLIISGEGGLRSVMDADIPYLPFSSWDGAHDPDQGVYSFKGIVGMMLTPEFASEGFKWVGLDSLTELSDQLYRHLVDNPHLWQTKGGKPNPLEMWGKYGEMMIGALKWIRDLPLHVWVAALVKEEKDDNDVSTYWPMIKGSSAARQIPGIFDYVFGLVKRTEGDRNSPTIKRAIITDEVGGWKCKARDPKRRLKPLEETANVPQLLQIVDMDDATYAKYVAAIQSAMAQPTA